MGHEWKKILDRTISCVMAVTLSLCAVFPHAAFAATDSGQSGRASSSATTTQTMHRMYNPNSGEHFYTASSAERDALVQVGWNYEGDAWTAPTTSSSPVYRLYSGTDHHYTPDRGEKDALVGVGWSYEGIGWYSDDAKGIPLYRQFNPNVDPSAPTNNSGSHNYTISKAENDHLVSIGWQEEGIGWYGVKAPAGSTNAPSAPNQPSQPSAPADPEKPIEGEELPEGVVYQPGVVVLDHPDVFDYDAEANTAKIADSVSNVHVGDTVVIAPAWVDDRYVGGAIRVTSITSGSPRIISGSYPELSEYVESMQTPADNETQMVKFEPAGGASAYGATVQSMDADGIARSASHGFEFDVDGFKVAGSVDLESSTISFSLESVNAGRAAELAGSIDEAFSVAGSIELDLAPEVCWSLSDHPLQVALHNQSVVNVTASGKLDAGVDIPIRNIPIGKASILDAINQYIEADVSIHIDINGTVLLVYELQCDNKVGIALGLPPVPISEDASSSSLQFKVDASLAVGPSISAAISFGEREKFLYADAMLALEGSATVTSREPDFTCSDLSIGAAISAEFGSGNKSIAEAIAKLGGADGRLSFTWDGIGQQQAHMENGAWVSACTWGYDRRAGESMKLGLTDNVNSQNRLAIFDYSLSKGGVILVTEVAGDAANPASVKTRKLIYQPIRAVGSSKRSLDLLDGDSQWNSLSGIPILHGAYKKDYQDYYLEIEVLCGGFTVTSSSYPGDGQAYIEYGTCDEHRSIEEVLAAYGRA